ncbi:MAG: hypothetical protein WC080_03455 [Patescibacteria group bacterium]|jgi:hypothetical protein
MIVDEIFHFLISSAAGLAVGYFSGNYWAVLFALISGFFIDADHLIDYFLYTKFKKFSLAEFKSGLFFDYAGKVYVFAHGFEYAIIFIALGIVFSQYGWIFYSLGVSNLLHLLYDTIYNGAVWPTYFLIFRIVHNFRHKDFNFPKCSER